MKRFRELIEERLNEGSYGYPADDMTMKEVKVACYAAQKILDMMEDGAMVQRWQISAIVKAAEELTSVYTSMSADQDEYEDEWDDEEEEPMYVGFEYPSMYESTELDEISMEKIQKVRDRAADRVALSVGRTEKDPKTGNRKWIPPTEDEKALAKKGMKTFVAAGRAITRKSAAKKRNEEAENLDEASTKVEIPKSRYETILKIHGPKTVARTPKGDMQYRGAREERHNKTTDTSITQTYSHPDHGVATIEKHTHNPTGKVTYYMFKKSKMNEEVELDEAKIERGKNTVGGHHLERDSGEHKMYTAYTGSLVRRLHTVTDKDDNILGKGLSAASAMAKAKLKKPHRDALMHDDNQIIKVHDTRSTQNVGTQVATPGKGKWFNDHEEAIKYAKSLPGKIRFADPKTGHVD